MKSVFLVVGSGVGGATVAKELANRGRDVIIVEKGKYHKLGTERRALGFYSGSLWSLCAGEKSVEGTELLRTIMVGGSSMVTLANGVRALIHQPSMEIHRNYYLNCIKTIGDAYNWSRVNTVTQIRKGEVFSDNTIENFPIRIKSPGIIVLRNIFKGLPGIIVATGPSLMKNLNLLKAARGKCVMIACDSSLKLLKEEGIEPDLIISIDFTENTLEDFEGADNLKNAYLVVDPEVYPEVCKKYSGRLFFIDLPEKPLCEWLSHLTADKGRIEKGLSVSHTAFLTAIYMGLNPIILTGQDLSFPGNETHARGTSLGFPINKSSFNDDNRMFVKNIFGYPVRTNKSLLVFLHHYREIINRHQETTVIDATEGGAMIEGAKILSLKDAILSYCIQKKDISSVIKHLYEQEAKKLLNYNYNFMPSLIKRITGLEKLKNVLAVNLDFLKKTEKMFEKNNYAYVKKNWPIIEKQLNFLKDFKEEIFLLRDNITEALVMQAKRIPLDFNKNFDDNRKNIEEIIERNKKFFEILNEASKKMYIRLEKLAKKLENI